MTTIDQVHDADHEPTPTPAKVTRAGAGSPACSG